MSLAPGSRVGPYSVVAKLGEGGMGEVYRARDAKLDRDVALKILPESFASDPDRLMRFEREAKTLASLNHPHIAAIYGIEERALVMELVEGEDLSARIARGPIPLDEALPIAKQIAEALEAAHEQGIIHRDLKPANIKVRSDGTVKVLDFGLAKALDPGSGIGGPGSGNLVNSPTITSPGMTMRGVILGTAAYMSPEQAKGKPVDKRADIWAFGVVLFEMLTGRTPFPGETITDIVAEIVKSEPDWKALDAATPSRIRTLLERCLRKDPRVRLRDMGDARLELEVAGDAPSPPPTPRGNRLVVGLVVALVLVAAAFALFVLQGRTSSANAGATLARLTVTLPPRANMQLGLPLPSLAVSPDGRKIVYTASGPEGAQLWVRDLDRFTPVPLAGTRAGRLAFFSPDGKWIGFLADGKLKKVPVTSGPPIVLCDAVGPRGGTWTSRNEIVFAVGRQANPGLYAVSAEGGTPRLITSADVWFPDALPGGNTVVVTTDNPTATTSGDLTVAAIDLASGRLTRLFDGGTYPRYAGSGHLLFLRNGTIMAATFDPVTLTVGEARTAVIDDVHMDPSVTNGNFAVSAAGVLVYVGGDATGFQRTLVTAGGDGVRTLPGEQRFYQDPRLAPDGRRIAVTVRAWRDSVWVVDAVRGTMTRVTSGERQASTPVWTPDGRQVIYSTTGVAAPGGDWGGANLFRAGADGNLREERLTTSSNAQTPDSVSTDGKWLVFTESTGYATDLFLLSLAGDGTVRPLVQTRYDERSGAISPDGRWLAYQSNRSGNNQVYVADFPAMVASTQISTDGGGLPIWARDGRHLYYRGGGPAIMAVDSVGAGWAGVANPRRVADLPRMGPVQGYDVMPDGRFLVVDGQNNSGRSELYVVLNWFDELRQKVPTP